MSNKKAAESDALTQVERDAVWTAVAEDSWRRSLTEPPEATFAAVERVIAARRWEGRPPFALDADVTVYWPEVRPCYDAPRTSSGSTD